MKKNYAIIAVCLLAIFAVALTAQAKVASTKPANRVVSSSTRADIAVTKCQNVKARIDTKVVNFENGQLRKVSAYQNMRDRISKIISNLEEKGVDASDLKADLVILDTKIKKLADDYRLYISALKTSGALACAEQSPLVKCANSTNGIEKCGQSDGKFKNKLQEVRRLMKQVQNDVLDIRNFYATTIKPDIMAARAELKSLRATSTPPIATSTQSTTTAQ